MKKILLISLISINLLASKQTLIDIEPAKVFYVNFEKENCNDKCLRTLLQNGLYISYLARFDSNDETLNKIYKKLINGIDYLDELNVDNKTTINDNIKIAIIIPEKVIKSYSQNIISPVIAYLISKKQNVYVKTYFTQDENEQNIEPIIDELNNYSLIITGYQNDGIRILNKYINNIPVFNPLAKANNFENISSNYTFGSIDYNEQVAQLLNIANEKIAVFKDNSKLANDISNKISNQTNISYERTIDSKNLNVNSVISGSLNNSSIFFNIPLIKTTLVATQIRALGIRPRMYLSTQINYHPMFLNLSQENERSMFYFANSIGEINDNIEYLNDILGQKIAYNWIAYSTSVGLDYYYNKLYSKEENRLFKDDFLGNSIHFNVRIMNSKNSKFSEQ